MLTTTTPKNDGNLKTVEKKIENLNSNSENKEGEFKDNMALKPRKLEDLTKQNEENNVSSSYIRGTINFVSLGYVSHTNVDRFTEFQTWVKDNFNILIDKNAQYSDPLLKALQKFCLSQVNSSEKELKYFLELESKFANSKLENLSKETLQDWGKVVLDIVTGDPEKTKLKNDDKLIPFGEAIFNTITENESVKTLGDALKHVPLTKMKEELKPFNESLSKRIGERLIEAGESKKLPHSYMLYLKSNVESKRGLEENFITYANEQKIDLVSALDKYVEDRINRVEESVLKDIEFSYGSKEEALKVLKYMDENKLNFKDLYYIRESDQEPIFLTPNILEFLKDDSAKKFIDGYASKEEAIDALLCLEKYKLNFDDLCFNSQLDNKPIYLTASMLKFFRNNISKEFALTDPDKWSNSLREVFLESIDEDKGMNRDCKKYAKENFVNQILFNKFFSYNIEGITDVNIPNAIQQYINSIINEAKESFENLSPKSELKIVEMKDLNVSVNEEEEEESLLSTN